MTKETKESTNSEEDLKAIQRTSRAKSTRNATERRKPMETVAERTDYFNQRHADQLEAVDHDMMRENAHSTMAISKPDRQSRVTFGGPRTKQ